MTSGTRTTRSSRLCPPPFTIMTILYSLPAMNYLFSRILPIKSSGSRPRHLNLLDILHTGTCYSYYATISMPFSNSEPRFPKIRKILEFRSFSNRFSCSLILLHKLDLSLFFCLVLNYENNFNSKFSLLIITLNLQENS